MFRQPSFSGSTGGKLDATPNFSMVTNVFPAGNPSAGDNVYQSSWSFKQDAVSPLWVRYTTYSAPNLPNPTIDFSSGLRFDIYTDRPLYVALLLRETNTTQPIGGNGGASGPIEFVGGSTDNSVSPVLGRYVEANAWTTLWFDIPNEPVAGFTGDGILTSTTGKGVLEALALVGLPGNTGVHNIYVDNFVVEPIPEPTFTAFGILGALALIARRLRR